MLTQELVDFLAPKHSKETCNEVTYMNFVVSTEGVFICNRCFLKECLANYPQTPLKELGLVVHNLTFITTEESKRQEIKREALAKLTDEEKKILNLI